MSFILSKYLSIFVQTNLSKMINQYSHISFKKNWVLSERVSLLLGEISTLVNVVSELPLSPNVRNQLMTASIKKGAQSTTAIEGNTLTDSEIDSVFNRKPLAESKEYLKKEVENILTAFDVIMNDLIASPKSDFIDTNLILKLHKLVSNGLESAELEIAGKFRNNNVIVGNYRPPFFDDVPELIERFCEWMIKEFKYSQTQSIKIAIIQSIVAHVYLELIHPFADGNGRTGRLLEYYILIRAGFPDIAGHILSNHYNYTRTEYYSQLGKIKKTNSLSEFLEYALVGLRDGLLELWVVIKKELFYIAWKNYIFEVFNDQTNFSESVAKRRMKLILDLPIEKDFERKNFLDLVSIDLAKTYLGLNEKTLKRDIEELVSLNLLVETGKQTFKLNTETLLKQLPKKKKPQK